MFHRMRLATAALAIVALVFSGLAVCPCARPAQAAHDCCAPSTWSAADESCCASSDASLTATAFAPVNAPVVMDGGLPAVVTPVVDLPSTIRPTVAAFGVAFDPAPSPVLRI